MADREREGANATHAKISKAEREREALQMRKAGHTFEQIAEKLGYANGGGAYKVVQRALKATVQEPADELRRLESERLDAMLAALWPAAISGKWLAIDRCLGIMDRRARLLGLDAPQKRVVTVITEDAIDVAIRDLEAQLAENDDPGAGIRDPGEPSEAR